MSTAAGKVAYHLRPNKAIDRQLFLDVLTRINGRAPLQDYEYVGFGGPFLEDFRSVHAQFGIKRMISLEMDPLVLARQKFNRPVKCIALRHQKSRDFLDTYQPVRNTIVWFDYSSPTELREQLGEFEQLLSLLGVGDIAKITVNANPAAALPLIEDGTKPKPPADEVRAERLLKLRSLINEYLPDDASADDVTHGRLPLLLFRAIEFAWLRAMEARPELAFLPLTSFAYNDQAHTMLTVTGTIVNTDDQKAFLKRTGIAKWPLGLPVSRQPVSISVPILSTKERLLIDRSLPGTSSKTIAKRLKFSSEAYLSDYVRFYRYYPLYSRVLL